MKIIGFKKSTGNAYTLHKFAQIFNVEIRYSFKAATGFCMGMAPNGFTCIIGNLLFVIRKPLK